MGLSQQLYDSAPVGVQNALISGFGNRLRRQRYGAEYQRHLTFLKEFDAWSRAEQEHYQRERLADLLAHARAESRFYARLHASVAPSSVRTVDDLRRLPAVTKEMLRESMADVVTIPRNRAVEGHTGGTTGKSLVVLNRPEDQQRRMATLDHFKARHGFRHLEMRRASFSGKHIVPVGRPTDVFWRHNAPGKQMLFSSFHITEANLPAYIRGLNRYRPHAIDGFFSCIVDIAGYMLRHRIALDFKPVAIFPTSETVSPEGRALVEEAFGAPVRDQYASSEGAPFVTECPHGRLHYDLSSGVIEPAEDGSGEVLVTSFTTYGTPLIRYAIGDRMEFEEPDVFCTCGLQTPLIRRIEGRALDFLYTTDGAKVNLGNVSNVFKNMPNAVIKAQVMQESLDAVTVMMVVDGSRYEDRFDAMLTSEIRQKLGPDMRVEVKRVEDIPRESSGKFRLVKNTVPRTADAR